LGKKKSGLLWMKETCKRSQTENDDNDDVGEKAPVVFETRRRRRR